MLDALCWAASRDPVLSAFVTRWREAGKASKQIFTAVARKLIITLNAMIHDGKVHQAAK